MGPITDGCIAQWQSSGLQIHGSPVRIRLYPSFWIGDRSLQKMRTLTISRKIQFLFTSFYCNGRSPARRQAWDHPKAALAWHLAKTCPFREIEDRISSHLHTTLNKSRDEKLDLAGAGSPYDFGKRAPDMVIGARLARVRREAKRRLHLGSNQGPIG